MNHLIMKIDFPFPTISARWKCCPCKRPGGGKGIRPFVTSLMSGGPRGGGGNALGISVVAGFGGIRDEGGKGNKVGKIEPSAKLIPLV